jgi:hypothetical protein
MENMNTQRRAQGFFVILLNLFGFVQGRLRVLRGYKTFGNLIILPY